MNTAFTRTIAHALQGRTEGRVDEVAHFLSRDVRSPRYVVGRNAEAAALAKLLPIDGLIDDNATQPTNWQGMPIVKMSDVPKDAWVLNTATSIAPVAVEAALKRAGLMHVLELADLLRYPQCPPEVLPKFVFEQHAEYKGHMADWNALYNRLADEESRQTLLDVLRFRLTADLEHMQRYDIRTENQYFEPFLQLQDEVFVDAGAFDGQTTAEFCKQAPNYRKAYVFEPSTANMAMAQQRLQGLRDIVFMPLGLSDMQGSLSFNATAGSACAVAAGGTDTIAVDTLDHCVLEPVSFIKMDLEGWELRALAGCRQHIKNHKPKLAISVYHQASHFREVMDWVLSIHPNYTVRLRHYTQGWSETVMFFTPN